METWDIPGLEVEAHKPHILSSSEAARAIVIHLPAGERLQEHVVHERSWLLVVEGELDIQSEGQTASGGAGFMAELAPREPHEVSATRDTRLLLFLAPWPGDGHPGAMTLDEKVHARERAQERADR